MFVILCEELLLVKVVKLVVVISGVLCKFLYEV